MFAVLKEVGIIGKVVEDDLYIVIFTIAVVLGFAALVLSDSVS